MTDHTKPKDFFKMRVVDDKPATAVQRTQAAMVGMSEGRRNQARAFFNRVEKRRKKRKMEKQTRKRMR